MKMQLAIRADQRLVLNQQLRQAITLLQYNTVELKQFIRDYLVSNPLLELEEIDLDPISYEKLDADLNYANYKTYDKPGNSLYSIENLAVEKNLRDYLSEQTLLCHFNPIQQLIAESIIEAIDDNGYLTMSLEEIKHTIENHEFISLQSMQEVLEVVRTFDPLGIACIDIQDCLLLQLEGIERKDKTWEIANCIVRDYLPSISLKNIKKIIKQLKISYQDYTAAMDLIRSLNLNPGLQYSSDININIEPELVVEKIKGKWHVFFIDNDLKHIKINNKYKELIKLNKNHSSYQVLNRELQEAKWLLKGLKRRNDTLLSVASHIISLQTEFLESGASSMRPLNIAEVAQALNFHESTISRVTNGKYISTPKGVFELKYFFSSHVSTQAGDLCSAIAVKQFIKEIIENETSNHILSDSDIVLKLKDKGINIARRTVAKYREALNILPSYQRVK